MKYVLETENLSYTYPDGTKAINNINLAIEKGEKIAIIGSNGAGKSTLFHHLNGLKKAKSGIVKIDGEEMKYSKENLIKIRQKVGVVFQNPDDQLFSPTVIEDVAFGPMNLGLDRETIDSRVKESLKSVQMEGYENKVPHHLSGGEKKKVAIAGVMAMHPDIMILDEPTAALDPQGAEQVLTILNQLNSQGMTIIISSHDLEMISTFADRIIVLHEGEIICEGNPESVFSNKTILNQAHLKQPKCVEILNILKSRGLDVNIVLKTQETCDEIIKSKIKSS